MAPRLPPIKWQDLAKFFEHHGFIRDRIKGSHLCMVRPKTLRPVVIPMHSHVSDLVISSNLRTAGLTRADLEVWLKS